MAKHIPRKVRKRLLALFLCPFTLWGYTSARPVNGSAADGRTQIGTEGIRVKQNPSLNGSLSGSITIDAGKVLGPIGPYLYANNIQWSEDGDGLYEGAQLIHDRGFGDPDDNGNGLSDAWYVEGYGANTYQFFQDRSTSVSGGVSQALSVSSLSSGLRGMAQQVEILSDEYVLEFWIKGEGLSKPIQLRIQENHAPWGTLAGVEVMASSEWTFHSFDLHPVRQDSKARFAIHVQSTGTLWLDDVSLVRTDGGKLRQGPLPLIQELAPPLIRFPGDLDNYYWKDGIGPAVGRGEGPDFFNCACPHNFGTDEFLAFCERVGIEPMITVSAATEFPQDAADWVEYCNGSVNTPYGALRAQNGHPKPYNVKYWQFGNEAYGTWNPAHCTPEVFAQRIRDCAIAMKAVDPTIEFGAQGPEHIYPSPETPYNDRWYNVVTQVAGAYLDFYSWHCYGPFAPPNTDEETIVRAVLGQTKWYEEWFKINMNLIRNNIPSELRDRVKFRVTEFNTAYTTESLIHPEHYTSWVSALHTADMQHLFLRTGVDMGMLWSLIGNFAFGAIENKTTLAKRPNFHVLKMYRWHFGQERVSCETVSPTYDLHSVGILPPLQDVAYLSAEASLGSNRETLYLMVINKHGSLPIHTTINIDAFQTGGTAGIWTVYEDESNTVTVEHSDLDYASQSFVYTFPPRSLTAMELSVIRPGFTPTPTPTPTRTPTSTFTPVPTRCLCLFDTSQGSVGYSSYSTMRADIESHVPSIQFVQFAAGELTAADLADKQVYVLVEPDGINRNEMNAIQGFLDGGGSLILLGDWHGQMKGISEINTLMKPFGIAYQGRSSQRTSTDVVNHSLTADVTAFYQPSSGAYWSVTPTTGLSLIANPALETVVAASIQGNAKCAAISDENALVNRYYTKQDNKTLMRNILGEFCSSAESTELVVAYSFDTDAEGWVGWDTKIAGEDAQPGWYGYNHAEKAFQIYQDGASMFEYSAITQDYAVPSNSPNLIHANGRYRITCTLKGSKPGTSMPRVRIIAAGSWIESSNETVLVQCKELKSPPDTPGGQQYVAEFVPHISGASQPAFCRVDLINFPGQGGFPVGPVSLYNLDYKLERIGSLPDVSTLVKVKEYAFDNGTEGWESQSKTIRRRDPGTAIMSYNAGLGALEITTNTEAWTRNPKGRGILGLWQSPYISGLSDTKTYLVEFKLEGSHPFDQMPQVRMLFATDYIDVSNELNLVFGKSTLPDSVGEKTFCLLARPLSEPPGWNAFVRVDLICASMFDQKGGPFSPNRSLFIKNVAIYELPE